MRYYWRMQTRYRLLALPIALLFIAFAPHSAFADGAYYHLNSYCFGGSSCPGTALNSPTVLDQVPGNQLNMAAIRRYQAKCSQHGSNECNMYARYAQTCGDFPGGCMSYSGTAYSSGNSDAVTYVAPWNGTGASSGDYAQWYAIVSVSDSLSASPATISKGGAATLSWSASKYVNSKCTIDNGVGTVWSGSQYVSTSAHSGTVAVRPTTTTTYTLTCIGDSEDNTGDIGTATDSATVTVTDSPPAVPTFSYLWDTSGTTNYGTSANGYNSSGYRMYMKSVDPESENVDMYYQLYNTSTGAYIISGTWSGWTASNGWYYFTNLQNLPPGSYKYRAMAEDSAGNESAWSAWQPITLVVPPISASCAASPATVYQGQSTTWTAAASGGNGSYTYSWSGTDGLSGTGSSVAKTYTTAGAKTASVTVKSDGLTKTVSCSNGGGTGGTGTVTVNSCNPTLSASPSSIDLGQTTSLNWSIPSSACATSCKFSDGHAVTGATGSYTVTPPAPTSGSTVTYAISCPANSTYTAQTPVTVVVPSASITAAPPRVHAGDSSTITWSATNIDSCSITRNGDPWTTPAGITLTDIPADPSRNVASSSDDLVSSQTVYRISCVNDSGTVVAQAAAQAIVNVIPGFEQF